MFSIRKLRDQRIRAEAFEECARIADSHAWSRPNGQYFENGPELNSAEIARKIRARAKEPASA